MFRGFITFFLISSVSISAYSKTCKILFQPLKLVEKATNSEEVLEREISRDMIHILYSENIIKSDVEYKKLQKLTANNPFLYEAYHNILQSQRYLEEVVNRNLRQQMRAVEMAYASGTSQVAIRDNQQKTQNKKNIDNKKVVSLAEVREKRVTEEKQEYEAYLAQHYSEVNYGFYRQLNDFFVILNNQLNNNTTVRLTQIEYQTMKNVADNFKVYSNYLLAKEILQYYQKPPKELTMELTAVLTRNPKLKDKFIEFMSYMEKALQEQKFDEVISAPAVERSQKQLLKEVKDVHLEGSEKRFAEVIHFLEGRIEN